MHWAPTFSSLVRRRTLSLRPWPPTAATPRSSVLGHRAARGYAAQTGQRRSRKSTVDLPQGLIQSQPLDPFTEDEPATAGGYPTVIQQALNNMRKFPECVLLTRVGSFYELYFEQAEQIGPLLNMKVASKRTTAGRVAMAGFPFFQLDRYLKVLVQEHGKHVAISEQRDHDPAEKVKSGGLLFDREVQRVITPGTLIDETFLTPNEHNYLLAIVAQPEPESSPGDGQEDTLIGLAWLDLSSGDFFTQSCRLDALDSSIARIGPREMIIPTGLDEKYPKLGHILSSSEILLSSFDDLSSDAIAGENLAAQIEGGQAAIGERFDVTSEEQASSSLLLEYVKRQLPGLPLRLQAPVRHVPDAFMCIDKNSLRGLEVTQTLKDGMYKGSLLQAVKRTSTESGTRLLAGRLTAPSMSLPVINERLDLVDTFLRDEALLEEATSLLKKTSDSLRIIQKFSLGRGDADDLLRLAHTIHCQEDLGKLLQQQQRGSLNGCLEALAARFHWDGPLKLAKRVLKAIDQEGLLLNQRKHDLEEAQAAVIAQGALGQDLESAEFADISRGVNAKAGKESATGTAELDETIGLSDGEIWVMRRGASPTLRQLHSSLTTLLQDKESFAEQLKHDLDVTTLTLKFTPGLGHIVHLKGRDAKIDLSSISSKTRVVSSSKSTRSFYHSDWSALGKEIEHAKTRIRSEESRIFASLREQVVANLVPLRRNAGVLDDIDVATSFARLAKEHRLVRPRLNMSTCHKILGGRHLMVEGGLAAGSAAFTPNDCTLGGGPDEAHIWLITGPNMAGKSTFLRQSALISILAQTGSFVPAAHAEIGLVDAIFSRVGSADNLSQEQSTFMVEMLETAQILRSATPRSFVIMDEVGRGTTPEDGVAVGYAVLQHLHQVSQCRALFATHFHALADMIQSMPRIDCYCTGVVEEGDGRFRYDHRLTRGVNRESHALKVARLAKMPDAVIETAAEVLRAMGKRGL